MKSETTLYREMCTDKCANTPLTVQDVCSNCYERMKRKQVLVRECIVCEKKWMVPCFDCQLCSSTQHEWGSMASHFVPMLAITAVFRVTSKCCKLWCNPTTPQELLRERWGERQGDWQRITDKATPPSPGKWMNEHWWLLQLSSHFISSHSMCDWVSLVLCCFIAVFH